MSIVWSTKNFFYVPSFIDRGDLKDIPFVPSIQDKEVNQMTALCLQHLAHFPLPRTTALDFWWLVLDCLMKNQPWNALCKISHKRIINCFVVERKNLNSKRSFSGLKKIFRENPTIYEDIERE